MSERPGQQLYFLPADGIEPEVIGADIERYLGQDARVEIDQVRIFKINHRRRLTRRLQSRRGYLIHARNRPTTVMSVPADSYMR
jgi:hypothetical protein